MMERITACLVNGPRDGELIALPEPMLRFRIAQALASRLIWTDLEDTTDLVPKTGDYERGRTGRSVTFYEWRGWK